ncbi:MAG: DMT family transporter [Candidatus Heimdallarchaeota archaeon]
MVNQLLGVLLALGAALSWALSPSLYAIAMEDTSPLLANAIRTSTAGLFSLLIAIFWEDFLGQLPFDWFQVVFLIIITFIGMGFGDWLYFKCLRSAEVSFIVGISNIFPLFVAFFTFIFRTEELTLLALLASIIIVSGVILVSTTKTLSATRLSRHSLHTPEFSFKKHLGPTVFAILAAFTWGITMFGLGFSLKYFSPLSANAIRVSLVGLILFLVFLFSPFKKPVKKPSKFSLALLGIAGILGLGIGSWLMLVSITLLGAAKSSAIFSVSPFFSALIAILVLKEKPTLNRLVGILIVCLGVLLMSIS